MFVISKNKNSLNAINHFQNELIKLTLKQKIFEINLVKNYILYWTSVKPSDNLNIYNDGIVIGKINFSQKLNLNPVYHDTILPKSFNTLLQNCVIKFDNEEINIHPNEQFNVFYSKKSISDYQLLLGKTEKLIPDHFHVAVLGAVGYFPGDLTIFKNVKKISYLHSLNFLKFKLNREAKFELKKNDDALLIERFKEIIPMNVNTGLSLSSGLDSRFVLGLLLSKKIAPTIYSRSDGEDEIVKEISKKLNLEYYIEKGESLDEYSYTISSDARIYYRGGNYNQLKKFYKSEEILHNGLWSYPSIEDAFKTAWKKPGTLKTIFIDLIEHALLSTVKRNMHGLKVKVTKEEVKLFLIRELEYQKKYFSFTKRKQWANWFYHINRGLSWTNSHMADASFYIYPVYLLGDKKAAELGLSSSAYSNFYKERLRKINQKLFTKDLQIDYSDGRSFHSKSPLVIDAYKLYYEYAYKLVRKFTEKRKFIKGYDDEILSNINFEEHKDLSKYFIDDLESNINNPEITYSLKRVMVTLNNVLKFLDN
tara:strand:+ start:1845 stop:3452 length:1608 start_codon:yes stop_codon:yes gene_type:complete